MTFADVQNFISSCGFPIACCIFLVWQNTQQEKRHEANLDKLKEAIDNQTKAVNELIQRLKE